MIRARTEAIVNYNQPASRYGRRLTRERSSDAGEVAVGVLRQSACARATRRCRGTVR